MFDIFQCIGKKTLNSTFSVHYALAGGGRVWKNYNLLTDNYIFISLFCIDYIRK